MSDLNFRPFFDKVKAEREQRRRQASLAPSRCSAASRDIFEAIERILTLGGVACPQGWSLTDTSIKWRLDEAREKIEALINETPQNAAGEPQPPANQKR